MPRNTTSTPAVDSARAQGVPSVSENATLSDIMTTTARRYLTHCGYPSRDRCIPSTPCVKRSNPSGSAWHTSAQRGRRSAGPGWGCCVGWRTWCAIPRTTANGCSSGTGTRCRPRRWHAGADNPFEHTGELVAKQTQLEQLSAQLRIESSGPEARATAAEARERMEAMGREPGSSLLLNPTPALLAYMGVNLVEYKARIARAAGNEPVHRGPGPFSGGP